jgi:cytochrome c biogenesis protein CcmG, thiol:disulfide interchange protein DsbE
MLRKIDKNFLVLFAGLLMGVAVGFTSLYLYRGRPVLGSTSENSGLALSQGLHIDSPAPDIILKSLLGEKVRLSDLKGKPVMVNFWASWCGPCRLEIPLIEEAYQTYDSQMVVLAVNDDESKEIIRDFIEETGITFPILLDPGGRTAALYQVSGLPTTFFIDKEGIIRGVYMGNLSRSVLERNMRKIGVGE